jgi:hypothetical protein
MAASSSILTRGSSWKHYLAYFITEGVGLQPEFSDVYRAVHRDIFLCTSFSNLFYFVVAFYMFRKVFPSIIRSLRLYIYLMLYVVLDSWWWMERPSETCRVLLQNKINLRNWWISLVLLYKQNFLIKYLIDETSVNKHPATECNIPKEHILQLQTYPLRKIKTSYSLFFLKVLAPTSSFSNPQDI